jgi:oligopeptide transport system substrate-binding protein
VHDEVPIIPLYIYVGMNYFHTNRVAGLWQNLLDDHPLRCLQKLNASP